MIIERGKFKGANTVELTNSVGLGIKLCELGAGIMSLRAPDKTGALRELIKLPRGGYGKGYHGLTVGRTAGRTENAVIKLDGAVANLEKNNFGTDNLHGGKAGLSGRVFQTTVEQNAEYTDVKFGYFSPDGEGGYFGNVRFEIIYRVYEAENKFAVFFCADPDCKTFISLTNHVYLNASGDLRDGIGSQTLYIRASRVAIPSERLIVKGFEDVSPEFDFRVPHAVGEYMKSPRVMRNTNGYDHPYLLDAHNADDVVSSLYSEKSGITINVRTSYPSLVFYGDSQSGYMAACLECEYPPYGTEGHVGGICSPERPYREFTEFEITAA